MDGFESLSMVRRRLDATKQSTLHTYLAQSCALNTQSYNVCCTRNATPPWIKLQLTVHASEHGILCFTLWATCVHVATPHVRLNDCASGSGMGEMTKVDIKERETKLIAATRDLLPCCSFLLFSSRPLPFREGVIRLPFC